ncbi:MAG TPA: hypothetical protein QKA08_04955 [Candidatus Megaira endosymbiont of Nemacystus decipiens]|nr:hypothetical protein [Candidatus Megaera endosymbiont of Nemacystus decipiens]
MNNTTNNKTELNTDLFFHLINLQEKKAEAKPQLSAKQILTGYILNPIATPFDRIEGATLMLKWGKNKLDSVYNGLSQLFQYSLLAGAGIATFFICKNVITSLPKDTDILEAVKKGDKAKLQEFLSSESSAKNHGINTVGKDGLTALEKAAIKGDVDYVTILLNAYDANPADGVINMMQYLNVANLPSKLASNIAGSLIEKAANPVLNTIFAPLHFIANNRLLKSSAFDLSKFEGSEIRDETFHRIVNGWMEQENPNIKTAIKIFEKLSKEKGFNLSAIHDGKHIVQVVCDHEGNKNFAAKLVTRLLQEDNIKLDDASVASVVQNLNNIIDDQKHFDLDPKIINSMIDTVSKLHLKDGTNALDHLILDSTPLMKAVENEEADIARKLLESGANVDMPNSEGKTAAFSTTDNATFNVLTKPSKNYGLAQKYQAANLFLKDKEGNKLSELLSKHSFSDGKIIEKQIAKQEALLNNKYLSNTIVKNAEYITTSDTVNVVDAFGAVKHVLCYGILKSTANVSNHNYGGNVLAMSSITLNLLLNPSKIFNLTNAKKVTECAIGNKLSFNNIKSLMWNSVFASKNINNAIEEKQINDAEQKSNGVMSFLSNKFSKFTSDNNKPLLLTQGSEDIKSDETQKTTSLNTFRYNELGGVMSGMKYNLLPQNNFTQIEWNNNMNESTFEIPGNISEHYLLTDF